MAENGTAPAAGGPAAVRTEKLDVRLGGTHAVRAATVSFAVGATSGLIGPNGAGKTTLLNCVSGLVPATSGEVYLYEERSTGIRPHRLAAMGISRSYQGAQLVMELTAVENVMVGDHLAVRIGMVAAGLSLPRARRAEREARERAMHALERVGLLRYAEQTTKELPYGVQKRVDLARALVSEPRCILLDEPMAGLSRSEKEEVVEVLSGLRVQDGPTLVIVEHDMRVINQLCSNVVVLAAGAVLAVGEPDVVLNSPEVIDAYIGRDDDESAEDVPRA
ncbi:branched-chain amino acid transport system ATP-binding protein [Thermomonospora echinospora]|uniref:Branched-chain amino acid transport system ATP-binding protein n=1 Tax=Thermomonospora echinospora TaxID=1992 RepID=A0A1H6AM33_9ACTN|nr:ATP-binding cassette domain-containing protein [Thermomonospora echinospora]SEG49462.1 branched-chain amino acid transport system ATP-binding protein [Thermomonospora echinospora]